MDSGALELVSGRERLPLRDEWVGKTIGLGVSGGSLFSLLFFGAGIYITLIGLKIVASDPSAINAPYWVLTCFGASFTAAGLLVLVLVYREWRLDQLRLSQMAVYPHIPVLADYPWHPEGGNKSPWPKIWKSVGGSLFLLVFLGPFNWWAWMSNDGSIFIQLIVSLFDLLLLVSFGDIVWRIAVANKYGKSGLRYLRFPYYTGHDVELKWLPPRIFRTATKLTGILRCVEEWTEVHGHGKNRSKEVIHEQVWAATRVLDNFCLSSAEKFCTFLFAVPAEAPGTHLVDEPLIFWELEVRADVPGLDFKERYLVPVYGEQETVVHHQKAVRQ